MVQQGIDLGRAHGMYSRELNEVSTLVESYEIEGPTKKGLRVCGCGTRLSV